MSCTSALRIFQKLNPDLPALSRARDGRWDRDPMGLLSRDASPGLGTGTGTDFLGTLGTGTDFSGTSRDLGFAWDLCPNESQRDYMA